MNKRDIKSIKANLAKGFQKDWFGGDCLVSHWFNAISMLLPRAEQFSLDTIGKFGDGRNRSIDNRAADIQKFFLDETIHGSLHQVYNDTLAEYGYENWIASSLEKSIRHQNKHRSAIVLVSMIAGFEHITATVAEDWLTRTHERHDIDKAVAAVWDLHAEDELDHRSAIFDFYQANGGGYFCRVFWYVCITPPFVIRALVQLAKLLRQDGKLMSLASAKSFIAFFFFSGGFFWAALPRWLDYFRPSFHPLQRQLPILIGRSDRPGRS